MLSLSRFAYKLPFYSLSTILLLNLVSSDVRPTPTKIMVMTYGPYCLNKGELRGPL